nr:unnamed protein product [Digitaria exilis]
MGLPNPSRSSRRCLPLLWPRSSCASPPPPPWLLLADPRATTSPEGGDEEAMPVEEGEEEGLAARKARRMHAAGRRLLLARVVSRAPHLLTSAPPHLLHPADLVPPPSTVPASRSRVGGTSSPHEHQTRGRVGAVAWVRERGGERGE